MSNKPENTQTRHGMTRREVLAAGAAAGALAAGLSTLPGRALAAPKKGGRLRLGIGQGATTDSLDPATITDTYMQVVNYGLRNCLTEINGEGKLVPELAESWEPSSDAATWRFKLRKGVEFHNGKTMDAQDVIASLNHHRSEDSKSAAKELLKTVKELKADGNDTVVFVLEGGSADWPYIVSDYHMPILPSKDGKADATSGVGTGGYTLDKFDPGVRTLLKRNPNYWKENAAYFDEAECLAMIDPTARTNALTTGEIDAMDRVDFKTIALLKRNTAVRVEEVTGTQHYTFPMRCDTAPFDNNDIRMALKFAIDREAMVKTILSGHGSVGNDHPIGPGQPFFDPTQPQRKYDPDKARFHLKKAGVSNLKVDLSVADAAYAGAVDAGVLYKAHAAKCGIDINVVREPNDGYWSNVWLKKPWCASYWGGRPTPDWMYTTAYAAGAPWNESYWDNEKFNKLLLQGRAELDNAKRAEIYAEMQRICSDNSGEVIPMFANYVLAMSTKVQHGKVASNFDFDGLKVIERWWFA
jgi:peptide/nickel transport system substrate-binding protein